MLSILAAAHPPRYTLMARLLHLSRHPDYSTFPVLSFPSVCQCVGMILSSKSINQGHAIYSRGDYD